jgi:hypothetical protein
MEPHQPSGTRWSDADAGLKRLSADEGGYVPAEAYHRIQAVVKAWVGVSRAGRYLVSADDTDIPGKCDDPARRP